MHLYLPCVYYVNKTLFLRKTLLLDIFFTHVMKVMNSRWNQIECIQNVAQMLCNRTPHQQRAIYQRRRKLCQSPWVEFLFCAGVERSLAKWLPTFGESSQCFGMWEGYSSWSAIRNDGLTIESIHAFRRVKERDHFKQNLRKLAWLQRELSNAG